MRNFNRKQTSLDENGIQLIDLCQWTTEKYGKSVLTSEESKAEEES